MPTLRQSLTEVIESLADLSPAHKGFIQARWLDQVLFFEKAAGGNLRGHLVTRLMIIGGGVLLPTVTVLARGAPAACAPLWAWDSIGCAPVLDGIVVVLGLAVALSAAVDQFFRYGEQWRHYRRLAEVFKSQGWEFFQLSGPYQGLSHDAAYPAFAAQIEDLSRGDVEVYFTRVRPSTAERQSQANASGASARGAGAAE